MEKQSSRIQLLSAVLIAALAFDLPAFFFLELQFVQNDMLVTAVIFFARAVLLLTFAGIAYYRHISLKIVGFSLIAGILVLIILTFINQEVLTEPRFLLQILIHLTTGCIGGTGLLMIGAALSFFSAEKARKHILLSFICATLVLPAFQALSPLSDAQIQQLCLFIFLALILIFVALSRDMEKSFPPVKEVLEKRRTNNQRWLVILATPHKTPLITYFVTVLFSFCFGIFETYSIPEGYGQITSNITMLLILGICLISYAVIHMRVARKWFNALFLVICIAYILVFFVILMKTDFTPVLFLVMSTGIVVLHIPVWMFLTDVSIEKSVSPIFLYGAFPALLVLAHQLGRLLSGALVLIFGFEYYSASKLAAAVLATIAIMAVAILAFVLNKKETDAAISLEPNNETKKLELFCQKHGLSERERDVIELYMQGRSVPYVSSELFIAKSTVKSHIGSVYTKLDIHSKQELLDVFSTLDHDGRQL